MHSRPVFHFDGWTFDTGRRALLRPDGEEVTLTSGEFDLMTVFCLYPQQTVSRLSELAMIDGRIFRTNDRALDVQISRLRAKIEKNPRLPAIIKTVRHGGYFFSCPVSKS